MPTFSHFSIVSSKVIIVKDRAENFDNPNIKSEDGLIFVGLMMRSAFMSWLCSMAWRLSWSRLLCTVARGGFQLLRGGDFA
jgi:hypothetical protein